MTESLYQCFLPQVFGVLSMYFGPAVAGLFNKMSTISILCQHFLMFVGETQLSTVLGVI